MKSAFQEFIKKNKWRIFLSMIYSISILGLLMVIFAGVNPWWLLGSLVWSKIIQLIGHSIGMHRYFSHRSFQTTRFKEDLIAWFSVPLGIGSPIQYARNHRFHHHAVDTPNDLHSPLNDGKFMTALGAWAFHDVNWFMKKGTENVRDLIRHPTFRFINQWYYSIWIVALLLTWAVDWKITIFLLAMPSFIFHLELNIFVNTIGHSWGYRNFKTRDSSRNNAWVQAWTMGEGLHNNHHHLPYRYDFAVLETEFDFSAWVIRKFFMESEVNLHNVNCSKKNLPNETPVPLVADHQIS